MVGCPRNYCTSDRWDGEGNFDSILRYIERQGCWIQPALALRATNGRRTVCIPRWVTRAVRFPPCKERIRLDGQRSIRRPRHTQAQTEAIYPYGAGGYKTRRSLRCAERLLLCVSLNDEAVRRLLVLDSLSPDHAAAQHLCFPPHCRTPQKPHLISPPKT